MMRSANKRILTIFLIITLPVFAAGCFAQVMTVSQAGPPAVNSVMSLGSNTNVNPTATPFQPLDPTPTYIPTAIPTLVNNPTLKPEQPSSSEPEKAERIDNRDDQINILILGSDQRIGDGGFRTDTIILANYNKTTKAITMISFPRDLYVYIPGWSYQRLNTAMFYGGFDTIAQTLSYNFGVKPEYYILVNFQAFEHIIESLGGIEVEVERTFTDQYWDKSYITIPAGLVQMNSSTALWYARTRTSSNDFDRARRQQEVLQAIGKRVISIDAIENIEQLYNSLIDNVSTNLDWSVIAPLLPAAIQFRKASDINKYVIGPGEVYDWITPGGAMVLIPRQDQISILLSEALGK
jgi:LCP family protein required for cell wall assembly